MDRRGILKGMGALLMAAGATGEAGAGMQTDGVTDETVYELRVYHLNEGVLPKILARFRGRERELFVKHGMHPVAYWTPTEEPLAGKTLTYMVRHKSRAAAAASWAAFSADPEWVAIKAETEKDGPLLASREITFLKLTDFSPVV